MTMREARERHEKLATELMHIEEPGHTIGQALRDSGYSDHVSRQGWAAVPNKVVRMLAKKGMRLRELGSIDAETQEKLVRGRLVYNTLKGSDKGVLSAKALGSDKRVNMFVADTAVGIVVLQSPQALNEAGPDLLKAPED